MPKKGGQFASENVSLDQINLELFLANKAFSKDVNDLGTLTMSRQQCRNKFQRGQAEP
jgi:hypothetical protein